MSNIGCCYVDDSTIIYCFSPFTYCTLGNSTSCPGASSWTQVCAIHGWVYALMAIAAFLILLGLAITICIACRCRRADVTYIYASGNSENEPLIAEAGLKKAGNINGDADDDGGDGTNEPMVTSSLRSGAATAAATSPYGTAYGATAFSPGVAFGGPTPYANAPFVFVAPPNAGVPSTGYDASETGLDDDDSTIGTLTMTTGRRGSATGVSVSGASITGGSVTGMSTTGVSVSGMSTGTGTIGAMSLSPSTAASVVVGAGVALPPSVPPSETASVGESQRASRTSRSTRQSKRKPQ